MKTLRNLVIIALFLFSASLFAQSPGTWVTYTFSAGDTVTTFSVSNADVIEFTMKDSSISGTDSLEIYFQSPSPITDGVLYTRVAWHDISQATQTTHTTFITAGDNTTKTFIYNSLMHGGKITGTFQIRRANTRTGEAVYAAKTRMAMRYR